MEPVYEFVNHTPQRVPLTDWYWTNDARHARHFQARPVIGGVFIKMLDDPASGGSDPAAWESALERMTGHAGCVRAQGVQGAVRAQNHRQAGQRDSPG